MSKESVKLTSKDTVRVWVIKDNKLEEVKNTVEKGASNGTFK
jgi:hypothetical protein